MKREEVLEQLRPLTGVAVRTIEHQPRTRVIVNPDQVVLRPGAGGHMMPLNEEGVKSLASYIGMNQSMGKEISPELFGQVATQILSRREHYSVMLAEGMVFNFGNPTRAKQISPERVIDTIERAIPDAEYFRVATTADFTATIEIAGEKREPVVKGDLVRAGALVNFSPIGTIAPSVQSLVVRLACTNGMVNNQIMREFHSGGGDGDDIWQWFRQSLKEAYGSLGPIVERYRKMVEDHIPPERRALILENMLRRGHIHGDLADSIRALAIQEPPRNSYEMLNLITYASSHLTGEQATVKRLQTVAADFTTEESHSVYCPMCHTQHAS